MATLGTAPALPRLGEPAQLEVRLPGAEFQQQFIVDQPVDQTPASGRPADGTARGQFIGVAMSSDHQLLGPTRGGAQFPPIIDVVTQARTKVPPGSHSARKFIDIGLPGVITGENRWPTDRPRRSDANPISPCSSKYSGNKMDMKYFTIKLI